MEKWQALGADASLLRIWKEYAIAFNRLSGRTHLLNALAAEALLIIVEQPCSTDELVIALAAAVEIEVTPDSADGVRAFLSELETLGLIARS